MGLFGILLWILFGALVGWIASKIMKTDAEQGMVANIVVGILGAFVGGFGMRLLTGSDADGFLAELLVAVVGAIIVIAIWRSFKKA